MGKEVAEGWEISVQVVVGNVAAAWVRRADHLDTRAAQVPAWSAGGLERVLALASMRMKLDASCSQASHFDFNSGNGMSQ